ncbi:hypothetical protein EJF36_17415 [Bacillus sp. HMF5848]|uniref:hypothetical protein n=1 Tax=Bacillus sp. HMF5848 TaxID=2495421 RepID=UPI000F78810D|nr:hypothetical protein [Bacillus sp. HMF5848]RSK28503.1 hypothetical protein EJF36_17415 [Bacillus sp. HMF5848]
MKKFINKIHSKETKIAVYVKENDFKPVWFVVAIFWVTFGTYAYNEFLNNKTVVTELLFLFITISIIWKNKSLIKPFFQNPFKQVGIPYTWSNILWIYPFSVLFISALFVIVIQSVGLVPDDPQNIDQMSMTFGEYITNLLTLPLLVFEEESFNVLMVAALARMFSKRLKHGWFYIVVLLTSCYFGFLHVTAWGWESAISRMFIHIPFIFSILYFKTAWISILAHLYQNAMTYTSVIYPEFPTLFVEYGMLLCLLIIVYRRVLTKLKR